MFSGCSVDEGERLGLAEPLGWPFGVPFRFSAAAACLRVRTLGDPSILGVALVPEAQSRIEGEILDTRALVSECWIYPAIVLER